MKVKIKRIYCLLSAICLALSLSIPAFAGSSSGTAQVKAIVNYYKATFGVSLTSQAYGAYTTYGTNADSLSVKITVTQKNKDNGKPLANLVYSSSGQTSARVSGSAGKTASFVSARTVHTITTYSESFKKELGSVFA